MKKEYFVDIRYKDPDHTIIIDEDTFRNPGAGADHIETDNFVSLGYHYSYGEAYLEYKSICLERN